MALFASVKNNLVAKKYIKLLAAIVAGTAAPQGCAMIVEKDADGMAAAEPSLIEVNKAIKLNDTVAVRATPAGTAAVAAQAGTPDAAKETPKFELQTGYAVPVVKRGGVKADIYPFDKMEAGQSFFIVATAERPNPAKSLASTCSSATRRYRSVDDKNQPTGKDGRKFVVRARTAGVDGETQNGARIYRVS